MEAVQHKKKNDLVIDFPRLWAALVRRKNTYFKVIPTVILVVWIISLGLPDYYKCKIQLAPEDNTGGSAGTLAMLASSFGVNIGGGSQSSDAITVMLYPDLLNSVEFKASLLNIKVQRPTDEAPMTYYDYLKNEQKEAWWLSAKEGLLDVLFGKKDENKKSKPINPFELTPEQAGISGMINSNIHCDISSSVAKQQTLITIEVTDQDPHVAAIMADSVKEHLQDYITDYKTNKARHDLEFTEKLYKDAKKSYERARQLYADFMDSNHDVIIENVLAEHQKPLLAKLREAGVLIEEDIDRIHVACPGELKGVNVKTLPYPGFPTDMQAQIMAMMTICQGRSTVMETVFENRFMHVVELNRMGANIATTGARGAMIEGPAKLTGCEVNASDLRAGAALILAGLVAEGTTTVGNLHHIDRGYEDIVGKLKALGADIQRISVKD